MRRARTGNQTEAAHVLAGQALERYAGLCLSFVFDHEVSLDAARDGWGGEGSAGGGGGAVQREVCTQVAKVCPQTRWARWWGEGGDGAAGVAPRLVERLTETPDTTKARGPTMAPDRTLGSGGGSAGRKVSKTTPVVAVRRAVQSAAHCPW